MQYLKLADAQNRLLGCLIQYNGLPFYVENIQMIANEMVASGFYIGGKKRGDNIVLNKNIIEPPKFTLGYANHFSGGSPKVVKLARSPRRHTYLGLTRENSYLSYLNPNEAGRFTWDSVFLGEAFVNLQNERFLTLEEIKKHNEGAISFEFGLIKTSLKGYTLYYEDERIGEFYADTNSVILYPAFGFAKETLERLFRRKGEKVNVSVHAA